MTAWHETVHKKNHRCSERLFQEGVPRQENKKLDLDS